MILVKKVILSLGCGVSNSMTSVFIRKRGGDTESLCIPQTRRVWTHAAVSQEFRSLHQHLGRQAD